MASQKGIFVHAEKGYYYVFFDPDDGQNRRVYQLGEMIKEIADEDAYRIATERLRSGAKAFPYYDQPFDLCLMQEGYVWLCGFLDEDEDYPAAMEIGRASLYKTFLETADKLSDILDKATIGEFMDACVGEHINEMETMLLTLGAITFEKDGAQAMEPPARDVPDGFVPVSADERSRLARTFWEAVDEVSETWGGGHKKRRLRNGDGHTAMAVQLITPMDVLVFEQCRIQKEHRKLKRCENCGSIFLTGKRSDEKYCERPSPSCPGKTCRDVGRTNRWRQRRKTDEDLQEKEREYARNYKIRESEKGMEEVIAKYRSTSAPKKG